MQYATRCNTSAGSSFIYEFSFTFFSFFFHFFPFSSSSCKFHSHSHAFSFFSLILFCLYRFAFVNVDRNPSREIRRKDSMDRATRDQKKISLQVYLDREVRNDGGGKIERDTFSQWRVRKISYIDSLWDWFFNCRSDANRRWLFRYFKTLYFNVYVHIYIYRFIYLIISFILSSVIGIFICKGKRSHFLSITIDGRIEVRNKSSFSTTLSSFNDAVFSFEKWVFGLNVASMCHGRLALLRFSTVSTVTSCSFFFFFCF